MDEIKEDNEEEEEEEDNNKKEEEEEDEDDKESDLQVLDLTTPPVAPSLRNN